MKLLRSNVEFAKRVFLDRLTVDAQPLSQPDNIDQGPGDDYDYGGCFDPYDFGVGADCSGLVGIIAGAAINGPTGMTWGRIFSTETFPGPLPGFRQTTKQDLLTGNYPIKVVIHHGGGGPLSHTNMWLDGWLAESNGDDGTCTLGAGAMTQDDPYWNDFWVYEDRTITEDTTYRQTMSYPRGLDYAGGRPSGADLHAGHASFVCRYLTSGGAGLPGKQLLPDEFADLMASGIAVVFNFETTADFMLHNSGAADAQQALNYIRSLPNGPQHPVVYFSCDFDEAESQQSVINSYLSAAGTVLGGPDKVGIYGPYYVGKRALDADVAKFLWQTEAWSGFPDDPHVDSRVNIMQRNRLGYQYVDGVQCDINEAHSTDYGQWLPAGVPPPPLPPDVPPPPPGPVDLSTDDYIRLTYDQLTGPRGEDGHGEGWQQLGGKSLVDFLAQYKSLWDAQLAAATKTVKTKAPKTPPKG